MMRERSRVLLVFVACASSHARAWRPKRKGSTSTDKTSTKQRAQKMFKEAKEVMYACSAVAFDLLYSKTLTLLHAHELEFSRTRALLHNESMHYCMHTSSSSVELAHCCIVKVHMYVSSKQHKLLHYYTHLHYRLWTGLCLIYRGRLYWKRML
jgi:hypothetical protein